VGIIVGDVEVPGGSYVDLGKFELFGGVFPRRPLELGQPSFVLDERL
jgi:hypothetical protein